MRMTFYRETQLILITVKAVNGIVVNRTCHILQTVTWNYVYSPLNRITQDPAEVKSQE